MEQTVDLPRSARNKTVVINKRSTVTTKINVKNEDIKQINKMKYLEVWITQNPHFKFDITGNRLCENGQFLSDPTLYLHKIPDG